MQATLQAFSQKISKDIFGMTLKEAHEKNLCISCKSSIESQDLEPIDADEYRISGLCPTCFDRITKGD